MMRRVVVVVCCCLPPRRSRPDGSRPGPACGQRPRGDRERSWGEMWGAGSCCSGGGTAPRAAGAGVWWRGDAGAARHGRPQRRQRTRGGRPGPATDTQRAAVRRPSWLLVLSRRPVGGVDWRGVSGVGLVWFWGKKERSTRTSHPSSDPLPVSNLCHPPPPLHTTLSSPCATATGRGNLCPEYPRRPQPFSYFLSLTHTHTHTLPPPQVVLLREGIMKPRGLCAAAVAVLRTGRRPWEHKAQAAAR